MNPNTDPLWQSTFQPDRGLEEFNALREAVLAQRTRLGRESLKQCNDVLKAAKAIALPDSLLDLLDREGEFTALVFDDPVFSIWLRFFLRAVANKRMNEVVLHVSKLPSVLEDVERRLTGKAKLYVPGLAIAVQREDLHSYVMAATPPTYDFTRLPSMPESGAIIGHPLGMQADVLHCALENIGTAWPDLHTQITECVRIFGYLPVATFRSCSAARYSGIVYLGNMDESLLDLEESIVHEVGHQVLYQLGELTRLTVPGTPLEANYVLPWSGSRRDLFGFLHAHYIYVLLMKYYWRRAKLNERDAPECQGRAILILAGCMKAAKMLEGDSDLTEQGKAIADQLSEDLDELSADMRKLYPAKQEAADADADAEG